MVVSDAKHITSANHNLNNQCTEIAEADVIHSVHLIFDILTISEATRNHQSYNNLSKLPLTNLYGQRSKLYYNIRGEIVYINGLLRILKDQRIIIPFCVRSIIREIDHHGHNCIEKFKNRAGSFLYNLEPLPKCESRTLVHLL